MKEIITFAGLVIVVLVLLVGLADFLGAFRQTPTRR